MGKVRYNVNMYKIQRKAVKRKELKSFQEEWRTKLSCLHRSLTGGAAIASSSPPLLRPESGSGFVTDVLVTCRSDQVLLSFSVFFWHRWRWGGGGGVGVKQTPPSPNPSQLSLWVTPDSFTHSLNWDRWAWRTVTGVTGSSASLLTTAHCIMYWEIPDFNYYWRSFTPTSIDLEVFWYAFFKKLPLMMLHKWYLHHWYDFLQSSYILLWTEDEHWICFKKSYVFSRTAFKTCQ